MLPSKLVAMAPKGKTSDVAGMDKHGPSWTNLDQVVVFII